MSSSPRVSSPSRIRIGAAVSAAAGVVLFLVAVVLDWSGFWGGFAQGAALALVVTAAYLAGVLTGMRRRSASPTWLPARGRDAA